MTIPKYLYHLTTKEYLPSILKNGLTPKIGFNSSTIDEEKPAIYLSDKDSIPFWKILLDRSIILQINTNDLNINDMFNYTKYKEYICYEAIPVSNITVTNIIPSITNEHMKYLCKSYMRMISRCTTVCADYYTRPEWLDMSQDELSSSIDCLLLVLNRLNFKVLTTDEIKAELIEAGINDCSTTFVDTYFDTDKRMYQQLIHYPNDALSDKRKQLSEFIQNTFTDCLDVDTGGYCW